MSIAVVSWLAANSVLFVLLLLPASSATANANTNATVYVVRHGEKTYGGGCLNIQGQERANHFPRVFNSTEAEQQQSATTPYAFRTPTAIFANNYFNTWGNCERCLLTVLPIAQALGIKVDFDHGFPETFGGNAAAADAIREAITVKSNTNDNTNVETETETLQRRLGTSKYAQEPQEDPPVVVLVAWEHVNIQFLVAELGVPKAEIPYWKDSDYDSVYVLQLERATGAFQSFEAKAQHYLPRSTTCDPARYVPPPGYKPPKHVEKEVPVLLLLEQEAS